MTQKPIDDIRQRIADGMYPGEVEIDGTVERLQEVLEERTCACGDEITDGSARCADCDMR